MVRLIVKKEGYLFMTFNRKLRQRTSVFFHSQLDMLPVILEEFTPKNDDFLRLRREELWIRNYQTIEFGANKHS